MGKIKLRKWDSAEHLNSDEDIALYLDACLDDAGDDPAFNCSVGERLLAPRHLALVRELLRARVPCNLIVKYKLRGEKS